MEDSIKKLAIKKLIAINLQIQQALKELEEEIDAVPIPEQLTAGDKKKFSNMIMAKVNKATTIAQKRLTYCVGELAEQKDKIHIRTYKERMDGIYADKMYDKNKIF